MSGHRKFWTSLWCHISTVSLVFKFSRAFLEIFRNVFTPTTSVMKFWSLCDTIFLWCTGSGSLGPVVPITGLLIFGMFWLVWGDWVSIKEVVHQGPEAPISLPQEREECSLFARMFLSDFWLSVWGHFSVTLLSHICFRLFLFQYGSDWQLLHLFLFLELVLHFLSVSEIFLYTVWRRKTFIQRTEFFLGWILSRERASSQGHMFGAAGPVKLDLNLEDFLEPGVRQLWRSRDSWVWGLSGTSFPPPADLQVSGKWRG